MIIPTEKGCIDQNITEMVSCIMEPTPERWGLRGDPFFWEELRQHFDMIPMPYDEWNLKLDIYRLFSQVTNGEWLSKAGNVYVAKYAHDGMSSGHLSGYFWRNEMIPILMERYHNWVYQHTGTFTKETRGLEYRYVAEKKEGCYLLKLQRWQEESSGWGDRFPPGWVDWDADLHIYADLESAQRDGNRFLVEHTECKLLQMENRNVVLFWNKSESNVAKQPTGNLVIYDDSFSELWNLNTFLNRIELCVGVSQMEKRTIRFVTFLGMAYVMDVYSFEILETYYTK